MTHRTLSQWQQIVDEQSSSGLSQERFCKDKSISYGTFQTWRRKLKKPAKPEHNFVEIPRPAAAESCRQPLDQSVRVRLELGAGVVLELTRA